MGRLDARVAQRTSHSSSRTVSCSQKPDVVTSLYVAFEPHESHDKAHTVSDR